MFISIIVPVFNEEKYISKCIYSVLELELPENVTTELLIIDGNSTDKTIEIVSELQKKTSNLFLIKNPKRIQAVALNIAIKKSKGEFILRLDAHAEYPNDYLSKLLETAKRINSDNTGGLVVTKEGDGGYQASLVQALTTHKFGVGNSGFRIGVKEGFADTVPYGFFKKTIFEKIGLFDERLVRAQDYEFNRRIIESGGKIWLNPDIYCYYYNQNSLFGFLKKQFVLEAPYNAYMWYLAPYTFAYRHAITGVFAFGVLSGIILSIFSPIIKYLFVFILFLYAVLSIMSALQQSIRFKKFRHFFLLPISFFLYHFIHGLGVLKGIMLLILQKAPVQKTKEPWPGAGRFRAWIKKEI
mgnify:CR=1 FL=1